MRVIHSAQFELSVDGVPRSYRDRKDLALQGAQILKARNPNSVVRLKDLQRLDAALSAGGRGRESPQGPVMPGRWRGGNGPMTRADRVQR